MPKGLLEKMTPEQKRVFIANAFRYISLLMLILGYILIMYYIFIAD